jgi:RNA polymerase sigma factor (sigma-70 family)
MMNQPDQQSSPDWIQTVVDRFEGPLVRYAERLTGDLETARDVVQEAFLRLCREDRADVEDHLAQWLYTVCRRRALDVMKKESRMKVSSNGLPHDAPAFQPRESLLEQQETASQLSSLLDQLPASQQEVLRLKFQAGLSYREISNVTELSITNVGYLIHTAIQTLRRQMAEANS